MSVNGVQTIGYFTSNAMALELEETYGGYGENMTRQDALNLLAEIYGQMSLDNNFENAPIVTWLGQVLSR
jgi:hypothetical protein